MIFCIVCSVEHEFWYFGTGIAYYINNNFTLIVGKLKRGIAQYYTAMWISKINQLQWEYSFHIYISGWPTSTSIYCDLVHFGMRGLVTTNIYVFKGFDRVTNINGKYRPRCVVCYVCSSAEMIKNLCK